ncbi:response regulator [Pseudanabaena sp. ABRG5-3]|uniref:response regulator n=1 Tax=Pseudanabaena sp. ABRG5-3 TaxID=685565 RepID=UPI000DC700D2|nr:response regulator [Pseudanabaena sp. ABRG5-3]BBC23746.1 two-component response regulator [Pseudanabaena sp. ABRG5-3]
MADRFLIIDDSATQRHLLSSFLQDLGHAVDLCESTIGALEKIINNHYTAVFLDIVLPDQDGYRFLREVRSHHQTANQYVILYSTKTTKLEIDYGLKRAKANDYLPKPVSRESLSEVLRKLPQHV